ncbi:ribonuclease MRP protein subunit rmp1 [Cladorrhinum sp. PSN259]|nr:ribonuclease MRP protein subunit rmp1 [Cladorrhinum sp. PSN259]
MNVTMAESDSLIHPSISPPALTSSIESLIPALEILTKFHHRNKNQHRLSKWWAQTDMVRRHTRKMIELLEDVLPEAEKLERIRNNAVINKKKSKNDLKKQNESVIQRAQYMRWQLGPGAYLAFTQVTADRQFAQLGLLLLGVLAQIDKALESFSPMPPPDMVREDYIPVTPEVTSEDITKIVVTEKPTDMDMSVGIAVSRDALTAKSVEQDDEHERSPPLSSKQEEIRVTKPSKKAKKTGGDEFDDIFGSVLKPTTTKKKAKKKAPTDEFDAIFGGGGDEPKRKKKKSVPLAREQGEFDDIFSTLRPKKRTKVSAAQSRDEFDDIFGNDEKPKLKPKKQKQQPVEDRMMDEEEEADETINFFTKKTKKETPQRRDQLTRNEGSSGASKHQK